MASGKKLLRVCTSLFDADNFTGKHPCNIQSRAADIMRATVVPGASVRRPVVDRCVRVVLDGAGPRLVSQSGVAVMGGVRRVGNILYTRAFAEA